MELPESNLITSAFIVLVVAFCTCLGYILCVWNHVNVSNRVSIATGALGVLGTLFLAVATFWSVHQNSRLINERIREREKPIAKEEIDEFIHPSIKIVTSNIESIEESEGLEWINTHPDRVYVMDGAKMILEKELQLVFTPADPFLRQRITGEVPDIIDIVEDHNQMVKQFSAIHQKLVNELKGEVEEYLREKGYQERFQDEEELEILIDAILKNANKYPDHQEFWESSRDELVNLAQETSPNKFDELDQDTKQYLSTCESLKNRLDSRKNQLKREYGITTISGPEEGMVSVI